MQISFTKFLTPFKLAILLFSFILASCGGGGGGGASSAQTLSGTAATGAALVGDVNIYGKNGGEILDIPVDALGKYSADVAGLTAPYLICAEPDDTNLTKQYSYSSAPGTANVTPLTTLALFYANNEQDLEQLTSTWPAEADTVFAKTTDAQKTVNANFASLFPLQNIDFTNYDFLTTSFNIGDALDQILDQLNIDLSGVTPVIQIPSIPGFNFNDIIDISGIDIGGILGGGTGNGTGSGSGGGSGSVTISGADVPSGNSSFTGTNIGNDTSPTWLNISSSTSIGLTVFQNNVVAVAAALNVDGIKVWVAAGNTNTGISGVSFDGTTVTFNNVTLTRTGNQPITLNGSLSK